jgi:flagellar motor switch protein FliN/FliY
MAENTETPESAAAGEGESTALNLAEMDDAAVNEGQTQVQAQGENQGESPNENFRARYTAKDLEAVYHIPVQVSAVLGRATLQVHQLLKLGRGAVVELDRKVGEAIDIYVNNRLVARGDVIVVDERLGVTMTEIIKSDGT